MRLVVLGLDGAPPERLLGDEDLPNLRRLMEVGCYGTLEGVVPPGSVPGWASFATGLDPGALGVYGATVRSDRSYAPAVAVDAASLSAPTLASLVASRGARAVSAGVPPWDAGAGSFDAARDALRSGEVRLVQIVDGSIGRAAAARPRSDEAVRDAVRRVDADLGAILESLDEETAVLVVSDRGAQDVTGAFRVNEWLAREGLLVLRSRPSRPAPLAQLDVDWRKTTCWAEGGAVARIWLNVRGREPQGMLEPADCLRVREDVARRLVAAAGASTVIVRPEEAYRSVRGVAPDLLAHFGALSVRADAEVGHGAVLASAAECADAAPAPTLQGAFVLAAPLALPQGEVQGVRLLDLLPTLLDLAGIDAPPELSGKSLCRRDAPAPTPEMDEEQAIRDRLSGLGYI